MDEVKIWTIQDNSEAVALDSRSRVDTEALLEETLVKNPSLLMPGLTLVGRQTPTPGGPLDLLGVDEDGRLVVFELKRGTLSRDAVAQVIDYASYLDAMELAELAEYISERSGEHGIEKIQDFQDWYNSRGFGELESLKPLRLFLVGLGADDRTERMVRFLAENSGMDISLLTFHGFAYDGKTLLARQVEVEGAAEPDRRPRRRYVPAAERWADWKRKREESGVPELVDAAIEMFRENWPASSSFPGHWGLGIHLKRQSVSGRGVSYARIDAWRNGGGIRICYFAWAKALCLEEFREPVDQMPHETYPPNRNPIEDPKTEIKFLLTAEEWETHKERLYALMQAVYEAWESRDQAESSA